MDPGFELLTDRLRLRAYRPEDVEDFAPMFADPEHMHWYPAPFSREESQTWIDRQLVHYREVGFGLWAVEDRWTGEVVGTVGPVPLLVEGVSEVELGWHVRPGRKGTGIAPEAGTAARDWAFANLDIDHLISLVRPENRSSARVAEKLGMHVDREVDYKGIRHLVFRIDRPTPGSPDDAAAP